MDKQKYEQQIKLLSKKESLITLAEYEISGRWWIGYISNAWLQKVIGKYMARMVKRKVNRYKIFLQNKINKL